jgi:flagellar basal body-associated protein FliL
MGLSAANAGQSQGMSLALVIILIVVLAAALLAGLALVMSRPKELEPHRPSWRRSRGGRKRKRRAPETDGSLLP